MQKSENLNELAIALAKAQGSFTTAVKDKVNPHFKSRYADLAAVWNACRDALSRNGLSVVQIPTVDGDKVSVETMLLHSSGQFISGVLSLRSEKPTPQGVGSAISYARRYGVAALVGVTTGDDDDDGEVAHGRLPVHFEEPRIGPDDIAPPKVDAHSNAPSHAQIKRLYAIAKGLEWTEVQLREVAKCMFQTDSWASLDKKQYETLCTYISAHKYEDFLKSGFE